MDNISIKRIATCHPKVREDLSNILIECEKSNVPIRITRANATAEEQNTLYQAYLKGGPKAAPAGLSYHNYGMAVDFCLLGKDGKSVSFNQIQDANSNGIKDWTEVINIFEKHGWYWGGHFRDNDHFEFSCGYTVQQLQTLVKEGKVDINGYVLIGC